METLTIKHPSDDDQRIDKFIKKYLPGAPLGLIYKFLRTGKIKLNRKKVEQNDRIYLDDALQIFLTPEEIQSYKQESAGDNRINIRSQKNSLIDIPILYEDESIIIVNKPPGLNVHPGDHKSEEVSLIERIQDILPKNLTSLSFEPSLVHRIDRETSGIVIIAKEKKALQGLLGHFKTGSITKIYHAICLGAPPTQTGTINKKLLRLENPKNQAKVKVDPLGQVAITHYKVLRTHLCNKYSLIELALETGRTHQIRVHLSDLGFPIVGDKIYGDKRENSYAKKVFGIERQQLHAYKIGFRHPITGKNLEIEAPYFSDMDGLRSKLS